LCNGPCLIRRHTLVRRKCPMDQDALCYRAQVPWELRPPSHPSYPRRDIWAGRTGARPLLLRQGPEGLPCGLHVGGSAPSPTSYTLFPLAGNSRPPRHLRFFSPPLGFHRGCPGGKGSTEERHSSLGLDPPLHLAPHIC